MSERAMVRVAHLRPGRTPEPVLERFFKFIGATPRNGCWPWTGAVDQDGYGVFSWRSEGIHRAHRAAYRLLVGPIPEGMSVLHSCDNRLCVNPSHLSAGTNAQNVAERQSRGRQMRGERHTSAKLTADQVLAIRQRRAAGEQARALATEYGVSFHLIYRIQYRQVWRHL